MQLITVVDVSGKCWPEVELVKAESHALTVRVAQTDPKHPWKPGDYTIPWDRVAYTHDVPEVS